MPLSQPRICPRKIKILQIRLQQLFVTAAIKQYPCQHLVEHVFILAKARENDLSIVFQKPQQRKLVTHQYSDIRTRVIASKNT